MFTLNKDINPDGRIHETYSQNFKVQQKIWGSLIGISIGSISPEGLMLALLASAIISISTSKMRRRSRWGQERG